MDNITVNRVLSPIALRIRWLRTEKGLTVAEVGQAVKIPVSRMVMLETDNATPTKKELKLLKKFYGREIE